jgi:hypothetical protein
MNKSYEWAAGLFEGEGCVSVFEEGKVSSGRKVVGIRLNLTDEDTILELKRVAGGLVNGPYTFKTKPNSKPWWSWSINRAEPAYEFLCRIRPYMGKRRKEKIDEALNALQSRAAIKVLFD